MKYIYILTLMLIGRAMEAQTITSNEWPIAGDTLFVWGVSDTSGILNPATGTQKVWDYAAIKINKQTSLEYRFLAAKDATNGSSFSNANLAIIEPGAAATTTFYSNSSGSIEARGTNLAGNNALKYTNSYILMNFPASYSNDILDAFGGVLNGPGGTTTSRFGNTRARIIGTGTLKLPGKTYIGCVLAQISLNYKDSVSSLLGSIVTSTTEDRFMWFVPGTKGWVYEIKNTNVNSALTGSISTKTVYMKQPTSTNGIDASELPLNSLLLYPNPAQEYIQLDASTSGTVEIYTLQGAKFGMADIHSGSNRIETKSWKSGIYIIRFREQTYKLVITGNE